MKCLYCNCHESKVIDSRSAEDGSTIRRRRECLGCGKRFTTYEKTELTPLIVIKKDNSRQPFNRDKLIAGLRRACEKRPVTTAQLEALVDKVESSLCNSLVREVTTLEIGEFVTRELKEIDEVSYIRFASVYREFTDVHSFMDELTNLMEYRKRQ